MTHARRLLRQLGPAALSLASAACGGGGDAALAAAASAPAAATSFNGTAYLKTNNTLLYAGKTYGINRGAAQGLVDQCNGFRTGYGLPPVLPSEATMASLDVYVYEKYFDTDKALTIITGKGFTLPDTQRWLTDAQAAAASGALPPLPPNCVADVVEMRNGTLWRDGLVYEMRYDTRKALGRKGPTGQTSYQGTTTFANLPPSQQLGQTCREVVGVTDLSADSHACIWDLFPYVSYLNWPYALSGQIQLALLGQSQTIVPVAAERGQPIPASMFEIPADFTVVGP